MSRIDGIKQASNLVFKIRLCPRTAFIRGAQWADQHPKEGLWDAEKVEKVLGNLLFNKEEKIYRAYLDYDAFFEDLRKAMEG